MARLFAQRHAGFLIDVEYFTPEELDREPIYRDLWRPQGVGWGMGTAIPIPTGENATIILSRRMEYGPFDRASANRLDELRPHLARSVLISARLQLDRARVAGDALAALGIPALVFDETGKVLSANALIEEMTGYVHWRAFDRVSLKDRAADQLLRGAIAIIDSEKGSGVRSFPIRDAEVESTMVAHVIPVRLSARDIFLRCAGVLAMTPVTAPRAPPVELVQSLFDLTPTEARVAQPRIGENRGRHRFGRRRLAEHSAHPCARRIGQDRLRSAGRSGCAPDRDRCVASGSAKPNGLILIFEAGSAEDTRAFATERASLCDLASCAVSSTLMRRAPPASRHSAFTSGDQIRERRPADSETAGARLRMDCRPSLICPAEVSEHLKGDILMKLHFAEMAREFRRTDVARGNVGSRTRTNSRKSRIADEIVRLLSLWRARAAHRRLLAERAALDDHTLRDIGVDCADLHRQASKPFWRA